jgi:heme-degrading monooxygenase HmoA
MMCGNGNHTARYGGRTGVQVRSIIMFEAKAGQEARFKAEFNALREAVGFPGFLGGEFAQSVQNPRVFTVTALWENRAAYAAWQARTAERATDPSSATLRLLQETLETVPSGKPYEIVYQVGPR